MTSAPENSTARSTLRPAVFLDRDGTVIRHVPYLVDPADVALVDGAGESIAALQRAGYACVIVTNQSAIGRGMLTEAGLAGVHRVMDEQLATHGVTLDGLYHSPHAPTQKDHAVIEHHDRKPGPGMLQRAAAELGLDIGRSWMVGDSLKDTHAGRNATVRGTVLVLTGEGGEVDRMDRSIDHVADDLPAAVAFILHADGHDDALPPAARWTEESESR